MIDLRLLVTHAGARRDVVVRVDDDHTVGDVAEGLASHFGVTAAPAAGWSLRTAAGHDLDRSTVVVRSGLRMGSSLTLGGAGVADGVCLPRGVVELLIIGGPGTGQHVTLPHGAHVVGRSTGAHVTIGDEEVSRRHLQVTVGADGVIVEDLGSANGTYLDGIRLEGPRRLAPGDVLEFGRTLARVETARETGPAPDGGGPTILFNRRPRMTSPPRRREFHLSAPPEPPANRRFPMIGALLPLVGGAAMAFFFGPRMLLMALLSPLWIVGSYVEDRRGGRREFQERRAAFLAGLAELAGEIESERMLEIPARRAGAPDVADVARRVHGREPDLWERRPGDPDFLALRLGFGDEPWDASFVVDGGGSADLRQQAVAELERYRTLPAVPVSLHLPQIPVVGLVGERGATEGLARWMLLQLAALHSPRDVVIAAAVPEGRSDWSWLTWLPHVSPDESPLEGPGYANTGPAAADLIERVRKLTAARQSAAANRLGRLVMSPAVVLFVWGDVDVPRHVIAPILEGGAEAGVYVVWLGDRSNDSLPGETAAVVALDGSPLVATVAATRTGNMTREVSVDTLRPGDAEDMARLLTPLRDTSARAGQATIPRAVALPQLLGMQAVDSTAVRKLWAASDGGIAAPVGVTATGAFTVDLRHDGPHALVGGTTGAGKSELLQTLVASMAAWHPPDRVTFLLIDYKGGAAFKDCVDLPHSVGFVTDLDGHLVNRVLVSLNAELRRREHLLKRAGAKDLIDMERRDPAAAPANLILIVDEFATLAKELPEFVDGVVNVAQRGRSLGIHLVLATQRPAGAINDNVRANTNLRMALRMNDVSDSEDVIGTPAAARLARTQPGRVFARTGHSELVEFQAAYAGGHSDASAGRPQVVILDVVDGRPVVPAPPARGDDERPTDLQLLVKAIREAAAAEEIAPPPAPWLPPLPTVLPLAPLLASLPQTSPTAVVIGMVDEPEHQSQSAYTFDFDRDGSLLVYGAGGSGKTTVLRTLAASMASTRTPEELHLYAVDFASRSLGALGPLLHTGAVIESDNPERVERLVRFLRQEIDRRQPRLAGVGAATLTEYQAISGETIPRLVVLVDGYSGLHAAFENVEFGALLDRLTHLVSEGRGAGVHLVLTADRRNAVPSALSSVVGAVLTLRLPDPDDYAMLGLDMRAARQAQLGPGRGFAPGTLQVQVAVAGAEPGAAAQAAAIAELARQSVGRGECRMAAPILTLPREARRADAGPAGTPFAPVFALGDSDLAPRALRAGDGHALLIGGPRSGRSTALSTIAAALAETTPDAELVLLAPRPTAATGAVAWSHVVSDRNEIGLAVDRLLDRVRDGSVTTVVFVDDADALLDSALEDRLAELTRVGVDGGVWMVVAVETRAAHRAYGEFLLNLRRSRHGVLLQPDPLADGELLGIQLPRRVPGGLPPGRGFLVRHSEAELIQVLQSRGGDPRA